MSTALEEDIMQEEYAYADDGEALRVSERLIDQHIEALTALANA